MTTDILFIQAQAALRTFPASAWDSSGYQMFEAAVKTDTTEEQRLEAWKKSIKYLHASRSTKFYAYARIHGIFADVTAEELKAELAASVDVEIEEWKDARFNSIERISDTLTFETLDGKIFDINSDSLFSQSDFRKAYFKGTTRVINKISKTAYEKFIAGLKITVVEEYSESKREMVEEVLYGMAMKLKNLTEKTEVEAIEYVLKKGKVVYDHFLFFKFHELIAELRQSGRPYEQQSITVSLKYAHATRVRTAEGNYWIYDFSPMIRKNYDSNMESAGSDIAIQPSENMESSS